MSGRMLAKMSDKLSGETFLMPGKTFDRNAAAISPDMDPAAVCCGAPNNDAAVAMYADDFHIAGDQVFLIPNPDVSVTDPPRPVTDPISRERVVPFIELAEAKYIATLQLPSHKLRLVMSMFFFVVLGDSGS